MIALFYFGLEQSYVSISVQDCHTQIPHNVQQVA
jgi:hypothetical protein